MQLITLYCVLIKAFRRPESGGLRVESQYYVIVILRNEKHDETVRNTILSPS
jgi:hypothetical protein